MVRRIRKTGGWYRKKHYAHFDLPMGYEAAVAKVTDPSFVSQKSFWPFLSYEDKKRRFRNVDGERVVDTKSRPIKYCSHLDGYIFAYYAYQLQAKYEKQIVDLGISDAVIGYRAGLGSNIDMAASAFADIAQRRCCTVICLDIKSFFDNIDHSILKRNLQTVLGEQRLTADWFAVFKAMTKYAYVEVEALAKHLKVAEDDLPRPVCSASDFRDSVRDSGLVKKNREKAHGIPQGSVISAVFSNIFMMGFDKAIRDRAVRRNAIYRRYSDDIMIICRPSDADGFQRWIHDELAKLGGKIKISHEKTEVSHFMKQDGVTQCDRPISYLGFTYDGERTLLRARTLSRYYRRITYATRHLVAAAKRRNNPKVYRRKLYRDFTHLGSSNFYIYAKRATKVLNDPAPKRQLRRHFQIVERKLTNRGR
jgi:RNA-directed DNA polymerase